MAIDPVLLRSKVLDENGLMSRPWARQQIQLQSAANTVSTVTNNVTDIQVASGFDGVCARDFQPAIWDAYLLDQALSPRDYAPAIQDVQLYLSGDSQRAYDDSELRALAASVETPNHSGIQQQIDELRALLAAGDPNLYANLGSAAFQPASAFDAAGTSATDVANLRTGNNTWSGINTFISGFLAVNGAAGTDRYIVFQTSGAYRWLLDLDTAAETGSNAGSNIKFSRYTDAGAYNGDVLTLNRASGNATLAGTLNAAGYSASGTAGVSGTITLAKLTTGGSNGSITVSGGIITGFTNPT